MRNKRILEIIEQSKKNHNTKTGLFLEKYLKYYSMPVIENCILYESFNGQGVIDNPYGLFRAFQKRNDFKKYTHIWVLDDFESNWFMITELSSYSNVRFVKYGSDDYLKYLSVSKYLINNCTFPPYFTKKDEQIYINTWHGVTMKKLGYDVPNSNMELGNTLRNFLSADYHITANKFMTEVMLHSYKLDGIYGGTIIEEGQPRTDLGYTKRSYVLEKLRSYGIEIQPNKKIILYAPTWSGTLSNPAHIDISAVDAAIDKSKYQILSKLHHVNYHKDKRFIPSSMDTNELLSVCDIVITDYSSIAFDAQTYNKCVIYYLPNDDEYRANHGLMTAPTTNVAYNIETLKVMLNHVDYLPITHYDQPICAGKILSILLDGLQGNLVYANLNKIKLLFYIGDFKPNGVTTSFMSLAKNLDYSKFDVSLIVLNKKDEWYRNVINTLNPNIRVLCRAGTYAQTLLEECAKDVTLQLGIGTPELRTMLPGEMFQREFRRCFGITQFDKLINFTGYSPFYSYLFMFAAGEKIVWLHNDMVKDRDRDVQGIKPLYATLSSVFTTYPYYDKLISASKEIMNVNIKNFPNLPRRKFGYAHNTLDYEKILKLSSVDNGVYVDPQKINFVTCGRLSYAKNHEALIRAFNRFAKYNNSVELYIIGDGELKDQLSEIAGDHVHLVGHLNNPFYLIKQCDCFVFPSLYEGQGIALMEARVLGLPIVVSDLPKMKGIFFKGGQYNIGGFSEQDIYDGLVEFLHGNIKNKAFNYKKYNAESYKEFEKAICG